MEVTGGIHDHQGDPLDDQVIPRAGIWLVAAPQAVTEESVSEGDEPIPPAERP
jgi:hypothetical protein